MTRLTTRWTTTAEEAFGETGRKGREGELALISTLRSWGWEVWDYEDDRDMQCRGIDVGFQNPKWARSYTGDVKANLRDDGTIPVYNDWLFKTKADRIFHVNVKTGWIAYYGVSDMIIYIESVNGHAGYRSDSLWIKRNEAPTFIKRTKVK
jgi:hypothetical protein